MDKNQNRYKYLLYALIQVLIITITFFSGYLSYRLINGQAFNFPVLLQVVNLVKENAIDPIPSMQNLEHGMIRGMLQAINDQYNTLYEAPQQRMQNNQLAGKFGGVGMRLEKNPGDNSVLLYPYPNSPAGTAGIMDGDILSGVDTLIVTQDTGLDAIQAAIQGTVGSSVKITITRLPSNKQYIFIIKRIEFPLPSVTWNVIPQNNLVGIIHVNIIASTTPDEIKKAMSDLNSKGIKYLIFDLRDDGGGLVDAGIDTAKLFLHSGVILDEKYRSQADTEYKVDQPGPFADIPMVVLVNHDTASSAEIIAGAIKAQKRALLIGSPTYGKNSIQIIYSLMDGSSLHLTVAKWLIPGLTKINNPGGLQPDVLLKEEDTNQPVMIDTALSSLIKGK
jgi:carboxyl-terminal processing protease